MGGKAPMTVALEAKNRLANGVVKTRELLASGFVTLGELLDPHEQHWEITFTRVSTLRSSDSIREADNDDRTSDDSGYTHRRYPDNPNLFPNQSQASGDEDSHFPNREPTDEEAANLVDQAQRERHEIEASNK